MSDPEREAEYRLCAAECFALARNAHDAAVRERLLDRARDWTARADAVFLRHCVGICRSEAADVAQRFALRTVGLA